MRGVCFRYIPKLLHVYWRPVLFNLCDFYLKIIKNIKIVTNFVSVEIFKAEACAAYFEMNKIWIVWGVYAGWVHGIICEEANRPKY